MRPVRILVVEDDPDALFSVATVLRDEEGFAVWIARDGAQAFEVAEELGFAADVLVVDLNLGPGMRGEQFVAAYRQRATRPVQVIVLSGVRGAHEIARLIRAAAVVGKPFEGADLVRCIRSLTSSIQPMENASNERKF
jgi:DNA-binding response OmpR family regulator